MGPGKRRGTREESRRPPGQSRASSPIPAPGNLEVVQAFADTVNVETGADELSTPRDLAQWLSRHALLPAGVELSAADLGRARDVRHGLRALLSAHNGSRLDEAAVSRLDQAAIGARTQVRFDRDGSSRLELISGSFEDALGTLLGLVHVARCEGRWKALKLCAHPRCRRAFFDFTKNSSGMYCTRRCADKIRAKAHRQRKKRQASA